MHTEARAFMWVPGWMANLSQQGHPLAFCTVFRGGQDGKDEVTSETIRAVSPATVIAERWFYGGNPPAPLPDWNKADLRAEGDAFCEAYIARYNPSRAANYLLILNEPPYGQGAPSWWIGAMDAAERHGYKLGVTCFSTGNPVNSFWEMASTQNMIRRIIAGGHMLALHEYARPEGTGRWDVDMMAQTEVIYSLLPVDCRDVPIYLTEFGMGTASDTSEDYFMGGVKAAQTFLHKGHANVRGFALWCAGDEIDMPGQANSNIYRWRDNLTAYQLSIP